MTEGVDPQSEALRFRLRMTGGDGSRIKCGMTKNVSFPRKRESRQDWIPSQAGDDGGDGSRIKCGMTEGVDPQSEALRFRLRMTGGDGSRIKCGMTKNVSFP